jgi:hypothetical protein
MSDFSLELAAEQIQHPKTKEYFKEVLSSYQIGNYRSAVVSLYTVVITDLINKLKDLVDREEDAGAKRILDEINEERLSDTSLSKWESSLVKKIYEETKLIEPHDKANIDALKSHRNLSAHPAITDEDLLFTPNKETVRAHIRNMLEGVLNKPAMFTHQIVDLFITKFPALHEQWSDPFRDEDEVDQYDRIICKRYLTHFTDKTIKKLFRTLYKLAYRTTSPEAIQYRSATHDTVMIILKRYPEIVYNNFAEEPSHYSNISLDRNVVIKLCEFYREAPRLYLLLEDDTQKQINAILSAKLKDYIDAWFLTGNPEEHYELVLERIKTYGNPMSTTQLHSIKRLATSVGRMENYAEVIILSFSRSRSYIESYDLFRQQVRPSLKLFSESQFHKLLDMMNTNSQIYRLTDLAELLEVIQSEAKKIGHQIDFSSYKNLSQ